MDVTIDTTFTTPFVFTIISLSISHTGFRSSLHVMLIYDLAGFLCGEEICPKTGRRIEWDRGHMKSRGRKRDQRRGIAAPDVWVETRYRRIEDIAEVVQQLQLSAWPPKALVGVLRLTPALPPGPGARPAGPARADGGAVNGSFLATRSVVRCVGPVKRMRTHRWP
jgi:hypothetical protein